LFMILSLHPTFHFSPLTLVPRHAGSHFPLLLARLLPPLLLSMLYTRSISHYPPPTTYHQLPTTDLLFYGILDGLMMLSSLLSILMAF
jgi:hypothetical protein